MERLKGEDPEKWLWEIGTIYDEVGDIRLLSKEYREYLLEQFELARHKINKDFNIGKIIIYGTKGEM